MKQITVKLPDYQIQEISEIVKLFGYPSRAEYIRDCIRQDLQKKKMVREIPPLRR